MKAQLIEEHLIEEGYLKQTKGDENDGVHFMVTKEFTALMYEIYDRHPNKLITPDMLWEYIMADE